MSITLTTWPGTRGDRISDDLANFSDIIDNYYESDEPIEEFEDAVNIVEFRKIYKKLNHGFSEWLARPNDRGPHKVILTYELKAAFSNLLQIVTTEKIRQKAMSEGRNLSYGKVAGILDPSANREGIIGNNRPAMKRVLGAPFFTPMVGSFLTNAPRIIKGSKGTVDPALRNLSIKAGQLKGGKRKKTLRKKKNTRKTKK